MRVFCKDGYWWGYTVTENVNFGCELQYCQWSLVQKDKTTDIVITICETLQNVIEKSTNKEQHWMLVMTEQALDRQYLRV